MAMYCSAQAEPAAGTEGSAGAAPAAFPSRVLIERLVERSGFTGEPLLRKRGQPPGFEAGGVPFPALRRTFDQAEALHDFAALRPPPGFDTLAAMRLRAAAAAAVPQRTRCWTGWPPKRQRRARAAHRRRRRSSQTPQPPAARVGLALPRQRQPATCSRRQTRRAQPARTQAPWPLSAGPP